MSSDTIYYTVLFLPNNLIDQNKQNIRNNKTSGCTDCISEIQIISLKMEEKDIQNIPKCVIPTNLLAINLELNISVQTSKV